jgi:lysophospholipase L1-like esterase
VCLEIAGRFYLTKILEKSTDQKFQFNSYRIYAHVPNFHEGKDGRDWIVINGEGFRRTTEVTKEKPKDTFRVFLMGGSAAHGISSGPPYPVRHIYPDETIDAYLEKRLRASYPGKNIEIINAAVTGYVVNQHTAYIMEELLNYHPDMFIFFDGANDHIALNPDYDYYDDNRYQFWKLRLQQPSLTGMMDYFVLWLTKYSAFAKGFYAWRLNKDADKNIALSYLRKPAKTNEELISNYKAASQKQYLRSVEININMLNNFGIKSLVIFQPILVLRKQDNLSATEKPLLTTDPVAKKLYPYIISDLTRVTSKFNVPFVDMNITFDNDTLKGKELFIDYVHLSPLGGEVVANRIYPIIDSICGAYFSVKDTIR